MVTQKRISPGTLRNLYSVSQLLNTRARYELGIAFPLTVYMQDPLVEKKDANIGVDEQFRVCWEPGIRDGPSSARFAVVDYNGDTGTLAPMATWDDKNRCFCGPSGRVLDKESVNTAQFRQVNVWAHLQRTLAFFESEEGLGRPVPFACEGNRLIVVPHAGFGRNAYYDRDSSSLQFYFFDHQEDPDSDDVPDRIYTCLSTDIIVHEFAHAVLDGIRPWYRDSVLLQTAAFHESMADMTAIVVSLEHEPFRHALINACEGDISTESVLSSIADQFGEAISGKPYLRSALNDCKMSGITEATGHHKASEVLTGAMFDVLIKLILHYKERPNKPSVRQAFSNATKRFGRLVLQALDLLPPVDVTFRDYALAVIRADKLANPTDPRHIRPLILGVFKSRGLLQDEEVADLLRPQTLYSNVQWRVFHDPERIISSRAHAYRFLDDNRRPLYIPNHRDVKVVGLYQSSKTAGSGRRMPRQIVVEYLWREDVTLEGAEFGPFQGESTSLLCGGTVVIDDEGTLQYWSCKPGTECSANKETEKHGQRRLAEFLNSLKQRIKRGHVGAELGSQHGLLATHVPPVIVSRTSERLNFRLSPHIGVYGEDHEHYEGFQWEMSS